MAVDDKYTISLSHFDSDLTDEGGGTWTSTGACVVNNSVYKMGTGALYTPSGAYLSQTNSQFAFGTGDFTIDFWLKYSSGNSGISSSDVAYGVLGVAIQNDELWLGTNKAETVICNTVHFVSNAWAHYALVRSNGTCYYFVNGILKATKTGCNTNIATTTMRINSRYMDGYVGDAAYYDEVRISNVARWTSDFTPPTSSYSPITVPTNLIASAGDAQVSLSWTAVTGATGYNVKRATTSGGTYTTIASGVTNTSYIDTTVTTGTTYYYVVTAVNADGESANSNEVSATPPVSAPTNLVATSDNSQVSLSWTSVTNAASYNVKRSTTAGGTYTTIASGVTTNSYVDSTVTIGTTYYYVVTAVNGSSESANSNEASATLVESSKALLVITMADGERKEYELTETDIMAFTSWFTTKDAGTGNPYYMFNKQFNLGPFKSRTDYLVFDKIQDFEVKLFTVQVS